jgi:hypothetical protein
MMVRILFVCFWLYLVVAFCLFVFVVVFYVFIVLFCLFPVILFTNSSLLMLRV